MKNYLRLDLYVPAFHLDKVKEALFLAGAGKFSNYDCCCWETPGRGQFRPLPGSIPFIGKEMSIEHVEEYKIEIIFPKELKLNVLEALRKAHPYEEPAFQLLEIVME
ncbi:MAG TPA: NGG1p interacting factor NIF3 [Lentisphaeria bacterium]|nr:MAG: hypothetical protein A2X47_05890 [Lentisphaerae bacterium GWF2_38_69]HBM14938.1 NGG1p interacting factor NIF3 [Lentisphaeria bacterium]